MSLLDYVELGELQRVQDMYALATGMAAVVVEPDGTPVTTPSNYVEEGYIRFDAGTMGFAEQIFVNGQHVGNVVGGRKKAKFKLVNEEAYESEEENAGATQNHAVDKAAAELLKELINDFVNFQYASKRDNEEFDVFKNEIDKMLVNTKEIEDKTKELTKISKQQNILSLNASIESARAGDSGRGFAIVANQMGQHAQKSAGIYATIIENAESINHSVKSLERYLTGEEEKEKEELKKLLAGD